MSMKFQTSSLLSASGIESDEQLVRKAKNGDNGALNALVERHKDLISRKVGVFRQAPVPQSVLYGQAIKLVRLAVDRYQEGMGAQFRTFLESNIRLSRYANKYKNAARIPEHRHLKIRRYLATKELLRSNKDREPTVTEMAEALHWSVTDAQNMETALSRRELAASAMQYDQVQNVQDRFADTIEFLYYSLMPEEQLVFDYSLGRHGKPHLRSVKQIADKTGLTTDRVYAIKRDLVRKVQRAQ